jgi:hypothetical protein
MGNRGIDWQLFDLHHANSQSISKAQKVHLTILLAYLCLVWGWHFTADDTDVTIQMLGITLQESGFWTITPFVVMLFSLTLIGTINAAGPAKEKLERAMKKLDQELGVEKEFVYYDLDTHKNIFDYFTFLRVHPERKHFEGRLGRLELRHFLYPGLLLWGICTTYYTMELPFLFEKKSEVVAFQLYASACLFLQGAFSVRLMWKAICRFLGVRKEATTY